MNEKDFIKIDEILAKVKKEKDKETIDKDFLANTCFADTSDSWILAILFLCLFGTSKNEEPTINIYIGSEE